MGALIRKTIKSIKQVNGKQMLSVKKKVYHVRLKKELKYMTAKAHS